MCFSPCLLSFSHTPQGPLILLFTNEAGKYRVASLIIITLRTHTNTQPTPTPTPTATPIHLVWISTKGFRSPLPDALLVKL